jgi:hypothetical protein
MNHKFTIIKVKGDIMGRPSKKNSTKAKSAGKAGKGRKTPTKVVSRSRKVPELFPDLSAIVVKKCKEESEEEDEEEDVEDGEEYEYEEVASEYEDDHKFSSVATGNDKRTGKGKVVVDETEDDATDAEESETEDEDADVSDFHAPVAAMKRSTRAAGRRKVKTKPELPGSKGRKGKGKNAINEVLPAVMPPATAGAPEVRVPVVADLSLFGFRPAPIPVQENATAQRGIPLNSSKIRAVVVRGLDDQNDILFRCEPTLVGPSLSSWCEKLVAEAAKTPGSWTTEFNINPQSFNWYANDIVQMNSNGYPVRLFHIPVLGQVTEAKLMRMFSAICTKVNSLKGNNEQLLVNRNELFWLDSPVVWSDVIGTSKAVTMIRFHKGTTYQGFYEANEDFILTYFRREDVGSVGTLYAPPLLN